MGVFSKASDQETPNVRKSDPDNFKFSYSEALNAAKLASTVAVSSHSVKMLLNS